MNRTHPRVSIVIPAYYSDVTIGSCLEALRAQSFQDFETIVVNSSPESRTGCLVRDRFPWVRFEQSDARLLPHAARNRGVSLTRGDLLVFTDPDCRARPDWLEWLVRAHDAGHPVVGGGMELIGRDWLERGVHLCKFSWQLSGLPPGPRWILPTANACYARQVWDVAGPLDGDRFGADGLLSWRARRHGYEPWFEPRAVVEHRHPGTIGDLWRQRLARGREFATMRIEFERWSRPRAVGNLAALPLLVPLVLARAARDSIRGGWGRDYLETLPVQAVGQCAWSLGEARGQLTYLRNDSKALAAGP